MLIRHQDALLCVVDVQERLIPAVQEPDLLLHNIAWLLRLAAIIDLPVTFTEQYPQGLGHTPAMLKDHAPAAPVFSKTRFSCVSGQCFTDYATYYDKDQIIVCGIETHVCVLQTVFELIDAGKEVFVLTDAVSSRLAHDKKYGLKRMEQYGASLITREMLAFECLRDSKAEAFRAVSQTLLREK